MAKQELTYQQIIKQIHERKFAPVYLLMGEEPYYIDLITNLIENTALTPDEQTMNQIVRYGKDTDVKTIINECRRFPMMSSHQVIFLKEAQMMDKIEELELYLQKPQPTTILVIAYKYKSADKRKKWSLLAEQHGVVYNSQKLRDYELPTFIENLLKEKNIGIDTKGVNMLTEFVGNDLSQLTSVINKLSILLPQDKKIITPELIEKNIGISKDYNAFELINALINRDVLKSNRIALYFGQNEKEHPIQATLAVLFNYFANLMCYHYLTNKDNANVVKELRINPYFVKDYVLGAKNFNKMQNFKIISYIREYDAKSKGICNSSASGGELIKELVFKILH